MGKPGDVTSREVPEGAGNILHASRDTEETHVPLLTEKIVVKGRRENGEMRSKRR